MMTKGHKRQTCPRQREHSKEMSNRRAGLGREDRAPELCVSEPYYLTGIYVRCAPKVSQTQSFRASQVARRSEPLRRLTCV